MLMVVLRKRGVERGRKRTMAGGVIVVLVFHGAEGRNDELAQTARDAGTRAATSRQRSASIISSRGTANSHLRAKGPCI